jgi:hypothetical protein
MAKFTVKDAVKDEVDAERASAAVLLAAESVKSQMRCYGNEHTTLC